MVDSRWIERGVVMRVRGCALIVSLLLTTVGSAPAQSRAGQSNPEMTCQPAGSLKRVDGVPEASGLVASRSDAGRLRVHNNWASLRSSARRERQGAGTVAVTGASLVDWEAMAWRRADPARVCIWLTSVTTTPTAGRSRSTAFRNPRPRPAPRASMRCLPRLSGRRARRRNAPRGAPAGSTS